MLQTSLRENRMLKEAENGTYITQFLGKFQERGRGDGFLKSVYNKSKNIHTWVLRTEYHKSKVNLFNYYSFKDT